MFGSFITDMTASSDRSAVRPERFADGTRNMTPMSDAPSMSSHCSKSYEESRERMALNASTSAGFTVESRPSSDGSPSDSDITSLSVTPPSVGRTRMSLLLAWL